LTDYIRPSPVYDGDNLIGYQVYAGSNASLFTQMGLQAGDVITSIGGTSLNDPSMAWELFRQVANGAELLAVIKREESFRDVTLDGTLIVRAEEARAGKAQGTMLAADSR
jgi:general secretion pathway protein C